MYLVKIIVWEAEHEPTKSDVTALPQYEVSADHCLPDLQHKLHTINNNAFVTEATTMNDFAVYAMCISLRTLTPNNAPLSSLPP